MSGAGKVTARSTTRRTLLINGLMATSGATFLASCGGGEDNGAKSASLTCATTDTLTRGQMTTRTARNYVELSGEAGKNCGNCAVYAAPVDGVGCGTCNIDQLPANPAGFCISWAEIPA